MGRWLGFGPSNLHCHERQGAQALAGDAGRGGVGGGECAGHVDDYITQARLAKAG